MGDNRLSVEITLVGADGVERKKELWLNWHEDRPKDVVESLMELADESQLNANWPYDRYLNS